MTGALSRNKGARGEREAILCLQSMGITARRTASMQSGAGSIGCGDLICDGALSGWHVEVKRTQRLSPSAAVRQARTDSAGKPWLVLAREDRGEWVAIVSDDRADAAPRLTRPIALLCCRYGPQLAQVDGKGVRCMVAPDAVSAIAGARWI